MPLGTILGIAGAGAAGIGGFLGTPDKIKVPKFEQLDLSGIEKAGIESMAANLPAAGAVAEQASLLNAGQLDKLQDIALPGSRKVVQANILDLLQGKYPAALERTLLSSGAATALLRGFGGQGYQGTYTNMLRGKAALEAMQTGFNMYSSYVQPYQQAMVGTASMFLTPGQRTQVGMWQAEQNYQRDLLKAQISAQPSQSMMRWSNALTAFGGTLAGAAGGGAFNT